MYGIFIRDNAGIRYAEEIAAGRKPLETRSRNMLSKCIGARVALIRTRPGFRPLIVGYADMTAGVFQTAEWMAANRDKTLIPAGSTFDNYGRGKWCYQMENAEECTPYELPETAARHGRSWCEFQIDF